MPLDLHHVVFVSSGGTDDASNLVPLCPLCHRCLHDERRTGSVSLTDDELKASWTDWVGFADLVPSRLHLGTGAVVTERLVLGTYALSLDVVVGRDLAYHEMREEILRLTVAQLELADPWFPFIRLRDLFWQWSLTSDPPDGWGAASAVDVLQTQRGPIRLQAPVLYMLSRSIPANFWPEVQKQHRVM